MTAVTREGVGRWLAGLAIECRCCAQCWERPCGGCMQGAPCDDMPCECDGDFLDYDDEDNDYDGVEP